jgi:hypothetical protein
MPLKVEYNDKNREVFSVVGKGKINSTAIEEDELKRDIGKQVEVGEEESFGFDSIIHKDMFTSGDKPELSIKKLYREALGEGTNQEKVGNYLSDIVGSFKDAGKNLVLGGAKFVNILGGKINQEQLDQKLYDLIGKDKYTGIDFKEQEKLIGKIRQELADKTEKNTSDVNSIDSKNQAFEEIAYEELLRQIKQKIATTEDKQQKSCLQAAGHILEARYLKELKACKQENRPLKQTGELLTDVVQSLNNPAFAEVNKYLFEALINTEMLLNLVVDSNQEEIGVKAKSGKLKQRQYEEPNVIEQDPSEKIDPNTTSSTQEPFDYSLLLSQKINQELVHLNNDSLEYLTYFFDASEKKTQSVMNSQDDLKPVKIFDVRSGITIGGNEHGIKKASFVRNEKEVTSYRNSSGQFTKKPSLYNYSINAHMPLVSFGGQEYSYDLVNSKKGYLGDVKLQARFMPYVIPNLNAGLSNGLNSSIGWQSGILIGSAEFADGSKLTANIFETSGVTRFNIGKSGFDAKAGFKASLANVKYSIPISEKCGIGYCFEGGVAFEAGIGIGAKAEIGFSNKKIKANLGGGTVAQAEISSEGSLNVDEQYVIARQKNLEQIQAKYGHFDTEIKKYSPDVIVKISMLDLYDFGNHEDFDSILKLAEAYSKK